MHADLILVCHASTAGVRSASFPTDEPLEPVGKADAMAAGTAVLSADRVVCAPSVAARQTASALGLDATVESAIADWDFGHWAGRLLADVAQHEPEAFGAWRTDPHAAPQGGESLTGVLRRVGSWIDECRRTPGRTIAVTHSAVIRAAIVCAIEATPATFWHLDVGPLSQTWLRSNANRWALRSLRA